MSPQKLLSLVRYQKKEVLARVNPIFVNIFKPDSIVLFQGHVGAGKTFLIKTLLQSYFGISDVNSPTYSYVKKYKVDSLKNVEVVHFDLYRLTSLEEFCDLGFWWELFQSDRIILIEWPEFLLEFLSEIAFSKKIYLAKVSSISGKMDDFRQLELLELFF